MCEKSASQNWRAERPRVLFGGEALEQLHRKIEEHASVRDAWTKRLSHAEELLDAELIPEDHRGADEGQYMYYGPPSGQVWDLGETLGLAYQMTGKARYAEKLREALLYYGTYGRWYGELVRWWGWHSELQTANFCHGYAVGYDCIHDFLSSEDRKAIVDAVIRLGVLPTLKDWILPEDRIHALDSMGHNWWSVCVSGAGTAALSLVGDEPSAEEWAERAGRGLALWFSYRGNVLDNKGPNFDEGGAFYEGVAYANYALSRYLLFRRAYVNTFGLPPARQSLDPARIVDWLLHTAYPTESELLTVNFGDSNMHQGAAETAVALLANGYESDELRWYLARTGKGVFPVLGLLCSDPGKQAVRPRARPTSVIYPDAGWAILRSSWEDDATVLAVKSGSTVNHAHADAGSFIVFHAGKPLITDSGSCDYGRKEYREYYCQSRAHNVVLFNGQGQEPDDFDRGVKNAGEVHQRIELGDLRYVCADATGPMSRYLTRGHRHFLWVGNTILVVDDLRAYEAGEFQWLLHYEGRAEKRHENVLLLNEKARAVVHLAFPHDLRIVEQDGLADGKPDTKVSYLSFSPRDERQETKFLVAIMPFEEGEEERLPQMERLAGNEMIGLRVREKGAVTDIYLNLRADGRRTYLNSGNAMSGWETDAHLLAVTRPAGSGEGEVDNEVRYFAASGSYIRRKGEVILDSLSKLYTAFWVRNGQLEVVLQGQPRIEAAVRSAKEPECVLLNGEIAPFDYDVVRQLGKLSVEPSSKSV